MQLTDQYMVIGPTEAATSQALANPQHGSGTFDQLYIQNRVNIVPILSIPLTRKYSMSVDPTTGTIVLGQNEFTIHRDMSLSEFISSQVGTTAILDVLNQPYATYSFLIKTGLTTIGVSLVFESQRLDSVRLERITPEASWANWCQEKGLYRNVLGFIH